MERRRVLELLSASGISGLAGCNWNPEAKNEPPSPDRSPVTDDTAETESSTVSDQTMPVVSHFSVRPSPEAAKLEYEIAATDDQNITAIKISSADEEITTTFDNRTDITTRGTIKARPGKTNAVRVTVVDRAGNRVSATRSSYARSYDRLDELAANVGCTYNPEGGHWGCKAGTPAIGKYGTVSEVATRHADQLTGHGIRRLLLRFRPGGGGTRLGKLLNAELAADIRIQYQFDIVRSIENGTLSADLRELRNRLESLDSEHLATQDVSPVVTINSVYAFGGDDTQSMELANRVREEYGGFATLQEEVRSALTVAETEPYLVAKLGMGLTNPTNGSDAFHSWLETFDAVTHAVWVNGMGPEFRPAIGKIQAIYRNQWRWAREHGLEFIPVVIPGYDNRANDCWETDPTHIRRDPDLFQEALSVAAEYATVDRLTILSFNDWFDGTQIEPGSKDGTDYGIAYLSAIKHLHRTGAATNDRSVHHVRPDGTDANAGSSSAPLRTIGHALFRARPGDVVAVGSGRYHEVVETVRSGTASAPITISGPADAVFVGGNMTDVPEPMKIRHSHISVTGMTFDGLQDPDNPDDVASYAGGGIQVNPWDARARFPGYVQDITLKPHAIGNTQGAMINTKFANNVEIGEFKVIGPGGIKHLKGDAEGHNGEVVYIGTPAPKFGGSGTDVSGATVDESHGYHIHHIDNSGGHEHAELVDVKAGAHDITIEYCTDLGGGATYLLPGHSETSEAAMHLGGNRITLRWSIVKNSRGQAVEVGSWGAAHPNRFEELNGFPLSEPLFDSGQANSIYGNQFVNNAGLAIKYPTVDGEIAGNYGPDDQHVICGNEYTGDTHGSPDKSCPDHVPESDTIGHLGGDSPWA